MSCFAMIGAGNAGSAYAAHLKHLGHEVRLYDVSEAQLQPILANQSRLELQGALELEGEVELDAERADTIPKVFTKIHIHFIVTGKNLKPASVARAVDLSAEKYCSATLMLRDRVEITHDFEIVEPDA